MIIAAGWEGETVGWGGVGGQPRRPLHCGSCVGAVW